MTEPEDDPTALLEAGWGPQSYADALDGMCALQEAYRCLDESLGRLPVDSPAVTLRLVAKVRQALDFIEAAASWDA